VCVCGCVYAKVFKRQLNLWCTQKLNNPVKPEVANAALSAIKIKSRKLNMLIQSASDKM